MEERFFAAFIHCFFISFGVMIGGTVLGSMGSFLTGDAPLAGMTRIAQSLRIWAIIASIGGTFDAIESFQRGLTDGTTLDILKQVFIIMSAMAGVKIAMLLISWLTNEEVA